MKAILIFIMILALSGCGKDDSSQDRESATDPIIYEQPESNGDAIEPEETYQPEETEEITQVDEITEPQQEEEMDEITEPQQDEEPDEEPEEDDTILAPFIWGQSKWGEGNWE